MNFMRETEQYYDWLYKIVCGEWEPRNLSFHRLLMYLFNRDYIPACEMDVCRATDGINLRYRFASENNIPYGKIDAVFQGVPCSMLEMMVALAIRIEEHIMEDRSMGNRVGQWFWSMLVSLGLGGMEDRKFDRYLVDATLERFLDRGYERNGEGGLFTITRTSIDMRTIDIWYQLMSWLNENEF